jgi:hypothetical protein
MMIALVKYLCQRQLLKRSLKYREGDQKGVKIRRG